MQPRHIVQISAECSGIAQRGGLGSVVWGLSDALTQAGHRVTVILPYYEEVRLEVHLFTTLQVRFAGEDIPVSVFQGRHGSLNTLLIHSDRFFRGEYADIYIDSGKLKRGYFEDDARRFAFFSLAAAELLLHLHRAGDGADAIHCHDWHAAFVHMLITVHPAYVVLKQTRRVFSVHNLEYQGTRPWLARGNLEALLDWYPELSSLGETDKAPFLDPHADIPCVNPMRAGLKAAHYVTTVSPTYADEIQHPDNAAEDFLGGRGLETDFVELKKANRLLGIVNAIDMDYYSAANLHPPFSAQNFATGRREHKDALLGSLPELLQKLSASKSLMPGVEETLRKKIGVFDKAKAMKAPLLALVSRLTEQKIRLLIDSYQGSTILEMLLKKNCTLLVLGKGNLMAAMSELLEPYPNALLFGGFDDDLEKRLYATADFMLMPSEFEPCGTSQMKAMRYGCLPVASAVGGLKDTIGHGKNGFLYAGKSREEKSQNFLNLATDLIAKAENPAAFDAMRRSAMETEFSWPLAAKAYLPLLVP